MYICAYIDVLISVCVVCGRVIIVPADKNVESEIIECEQNIVNCLINHKESLFIIFC